MTDESGPLGSLSYQYDAASNLTRITWPDSYYVSYAVNAVGQVTQAHETGTTLLKSWAFDTLARPSTITSGNGVVETRSYDSHGRFNGFAYDLAGTANDVSIGLTLNPAGQIAGQHRERAVRVPGRGCG